MSRSEHYTVVIRGGQDSPNILSGDETAAKFFINWATVIPKKHQKFTLYSYFRTHTRPTSEVEPDPIIYVECSAFPKVGFFDNLRNSASSIVAIAPPNINFSDSSGNTYFHHESKSIPMTVSYPHQDVFDIKLTNIAGAVLDADDFTNWVLVLDLVPID
jgi:hypothetical protein